jgi:hypothetical protein
VDTGKHRHRRTGRSRRPLTAALTIVKAMALGSFLSLVVAGGLHSSGSAATSHTNAVDDAYGRVAARAVVDHRCTSEGVTRGARTASALIRTEGGHVRAVSFETGWDVFNGKRPGRLIAVCVD